MKVEEICSVLNGEMVCGSNKLNHEVTHAFASDLLSDVMGHAEAGTVWITIQTHSNVLAIASLRDLAAVIITCGEKPGEDTMTQSNEEAIPVLGTDLPPFELAGELPIHISPPAPPVRWVSACLCCR